MCLILQLSWWLAHMNVHTLQLLGFIVACFPAVHLLTQWPLDTSQGLLIRGSSLLRWYVNTVTGTAKTSLSLVIGHPYPWELTV